MSLFKKEKLLSGRIHIYFCGIKIFSYEKKYKKHKVIGTNNIVRIHEHSNVKLVIYGNNNTVIIDNHKDFDKFIINIGVPDCECNNCVIKIGDNFSSNGAKMIILEDNTVVEIGDDCMFSSNIVFWPSDTHTVMDINGNIINVGEYIKIGNHVWIGYGATILKNTIIPDNCIIGAGSVVSGKFEKTNCVIAGNPAKVVKENINWDRRRPKQFLINKTTTK